MPQPRPVRLAVALVAVVSFLAQRPAHGAGLGIPDLGGAALGQGGAFIARPDDVSAMYYNPAGLANVEGLQLQLDARWTNLQVEFTRSDQLVKASGQGDERYFDLPFETVRNQGGPSITPMFGIAYKLKLPNFIPLTIAIGGHPFNGYTGAKYPDPAAIAEADSELTSAELGAKTGQRYSSVHATSMIFVPLVAVGARVTDWLDLGFSLQSAVASLTTRQAIYANPDPNLDPSGTGESTDFDALFEISAFDGSTISGVLGATVKLPADLYFGASFQLPTFFSASGTAKAELPQAMKDLGVEVAGDKANIDITFPWIARAGLRLVKPAFEVELAGTYEAWSMQKEITLTPQDISVKVGSREPEKLPVIRIAKDLQDAGSIRLGGVVRLGAFVPALKFLTLRLGGIYETSAVPLDKQTVDTPHWERFTANVGLGFRFGPFDAALAYAHFFQADRVVTNSTIKQTVAFEKGEQYPDGVDPNIVGNGRFRTQVDMLTAMIGYRFDL